MPEVKRFHIGDRVRFVSDGIIGEINEAELSAWILSPESMCEVFYVTNVNHDLYDISTEPANEFLFFEEDDEYDEYDEYDEETQVIVHRNIHGARLERWLGETEIKKYERKCLKGD